MRVVVYTVATAGRSKIHPPAVVEPGVRYLAFTDAECPAPYECMPPLIGAGSAARDSRIPKILAHQHIDADISIYHDASLHLRMAPSAIIAQYLRDAEIAMHRHPCRKCAYEEARHLIEYGIGRKEEIRDQIHAMQFAAFPEGLGLWACGIILRRHTDRVMAFERAWWDAFAAGCVRDQVAMPYAKWQTGVEIRDIPGDVYNSPIADYHGHIGKK